MQMLRSLYEIELKATGAQLLTSKQEDENWMGFPDSQLCDAALC
jgi:hypothetical protein